MELQEEAIHVGFFNLANIFAVEVEKYKKKFCFFKSAYFFLDS